MWFDSLLAHASMHQECAPTTVFSCVLLSTFAYPLYSRVYASKTQCVQCDYAYLLQASLGIITYGIEVDAGYVIFVWN